MKIVIDTKKLDFTSFENAQDVMKAFSAVNNAKIAELPKNHGRLIDADKTLKSMDTYDKFGYTETGAFVREPTNDYVPYVHYEDMIECVCNSTTILEAESED